MEKREIPMYYMKITVYADELLETFRTLPGWPERVKTMQVNWIGKRFGVDVTFPDVAYPGMPQALKVFTTRADTLLGVTMSPWQRASSRAICGETQSIACRVHRGVQARRHDGS